MSRARTAKAPPVIGIIRMTFSDAMAWYESQPPTHPANILSELPIEIIIYPDLVAAAEPGPVSSEVRELIVGALAEALVRAYRRAQENDLASRAALALSGSKEDHA